jgi:hypothetical protein
VDYWSGMCYLLVFSALLEYSAVLYLKKDDFNGYGMNADRKRTAKVVSL